MDRRGFLSTLALLATGVAGCGGGDSSDPTPGPSPVASPVGVGIYRATELTHLASAGVFPQHVLPDGTIYGWKNSGEAGILTSQGVFTPFEVVPPAGASSRPVIDTSSYVVATNGDAFLTFNKSIWYQPQFSVFYERATRKVRTVNFSAPSDFSRSIIAISSRKEIFGFQTNDSRVRAFCRYSEDADGIWRPFELWNEREFAMGTDDRYVLADSVERGVFPGSSQESARRTAVYRDGAVMELPDVDSQSWSAEALLPDGSIAGDTGKRIVLWRDGAIAMGTQNTGYTSLATTTEDGWIVYTVAGMGYRITNGSEEYPLVVYDDGGNMMPPYQIMTALSGRRLLAAYYFDVTRQTGNYILTPTW